MLSNCGLELCYGSLAEWSKRHGILPTYPTTERKAVSVIVQSNDPARHELFRLTDHVVSSSCGVVLWLLPREE